jgi:hypothetical protein
VTAAEARRFVQMGLLDPAALSDIEHRQESQMTKRVEPQITVADDLIPGRLKPALHVTIAFGPITALFEVARQRQGVLALRPPVASNGQPGVTVLDDLADEILRRAGPVLERLR